MADSEQKKLIKFGNSSFIITLPKPWIDKNKLKKGDLIFLEETASNELVINTQEKKEKNTKSIELNFESMKLKDFERELISAYINNYSEINIVGKGLNLKTNIISKAIQDKVGLEISEQSADKVIVRDVLDLEAMSLEKVVRRLDNMLRAIFDEIKEGIKMGKIKDWSIKEIINIEGGINKFYYLSWKIIRKCQEDPKLLNKLKLSSRKISDIQWVVLHLEYIGDELKRMAKILHTDGVFDQKRLLLTLENIEAGYIDMISSFYNEDLESARKLMATKSSRIEMCDKLLVSESRLPNGAEKVVEKMKSISGFIHNISRVIGYY